MYRPDVVSLKQFYASALGLRARGLLWRHLMAVWPEVKGDATLGLGYATPFLDAKEGAFVVAGMPATQGALYWPMAAENRSALLDEAALPFGDAAFNRVLLVHALEHAHDPHAVMAEVWRVLVAGGRALAVVPNRGGLWSRSARSPFGSGRPFSGAQIRDLIEASGLTVLRTESALYIPPRGANWLHRIAPTVELLGRMFLPRMGGVLILEVEKQIYAGIREPVRKLAHPLAVAARPAHAPGLGAGATQHLPNGAHNTHTSARR